MMSMMKFRDSTLNFVWVGGYYSTGTRTRINRYLTLDVIVILFSVFEQCTVFFMCVRLVSTLKRKT